MTPQHLRYFIAIAEMGSLREAAEERLYTSQPLLSRQIRDQEYEVGVTLLSRGARGVELTTSGRPFLDHARLALAQVDAAGETARRLRGSPRWVHRDLPCVARRQPRCGHSVPRAGPSYRRVHPTEVIEKGAL
jgi:DNA-binding transcriptional LysR family regulator